MTIAAQAKYDVCHLGLIYSQEYAYSLPKTILESFLQGKAFDHPVDTAIIILLI